jgi:hypothetical protein
MSASDEDPRRKRRGRPPLCPRKTCLFVIELQEQGLSLARISATLNERGMSTPTGQSEWTKSDVDRLLRTMYIRDLKEELPDAGSRITNN